MYLSNLDLMLESIYMAMDEHGIKCDDGHWMTEEELFSLPEAAVSVNSALKGNAGITIGNVVGSNIMNVLLLFNQIYGRG